MSLVPQLQAGVLNAWILMLYLPLHPVIMLVIDKIAGTGEMMKKMEEPRYTKTEKIINILGNFVLFFGLFIFSIFLPLKLGTAWFYVGLALCVIGVVIWTVAIVNIVQVPLGEPWERGLYRYSRHPMFIAESLILLGTGIASASWIFLLFAVVSITLSAILVLAEERSCREKYGDSYCTYINRTPRWMGIPGTN
jgi:protein-S-isoprenylcysteine O-methyltransferase Ste14